MSVHEKLKISYNYTRKQEPNYWWDDRPMETSENDCILVLEPKGVTNPMLLFITSKCLT